MGKRAIEIIPVQTKKDLNQFIKLPWKIYKTDKYWVPPLISKQKEILNNKTFPFFEHSEADFFLAKQGKETVGTIAAILNNRHNEIHEENVGFFGFFEVIDNYQVAEKLLDKVMDWGAAVSYTHLTLPTIYSV